MKRQLPQDGNAKKVHKISACKPSNELFWSLISGCDWQNLRAIKLPNSKLQSVPNTISKLEHLQELILQNNELKTLPPELFTLKNLRRLNLTQNKLESVPPIIAALTGLQELALSANSLTEIPDGISRLSSLHHLSLHSNRITLLPDTLFARMPYLKSLFLFHNRLTRLPQSICRLQNLDTLNITGNPIRHLPVRIRDLKDLVFFNSDAHVEGECPAENLPDSCEYYCVAPLRELATVALIANRFIIEHLKLPIDVKEMLAERLSECDGAKCTQKYFSAYHSEIKCEAWSRGKNVNKPERHRLLEIESKERKKLDKEMERLQKKMEKQQQKSEKTKKTSSKKGSAFLAFAGDRKKN